MKISFKPTKEKTLSDEIAQKILSQEDRFLFLFEILEKLPLELVKWLVSWIKSQSTTKSYVEIDISQSVHFPIITGDLVIRKHRNPKVGDIVELSLRYQNSEIYGSEICRVISVDFKNSILVVEDIIEPKRTWNAGVYNILCIIDKVIPFGTVEWETSVKILNMEYHYSEIKTWLTRSFEFVENTADFYQKEEILNQLKERLELVNQNDKDSHLR